MSTNYSPTPDSGEYIDIFSLLKGMGRFIGRLLQAVFRNLPLVLVCLALALGLAYYEYKSRPPYYISEMVVTTGPLDPMVSTVLLERLSADIEDQSPEYLAKKLHISAAAASQVSSIGSIELPPTNLTNQYDSLGIRAQPMVFSVTVKDPVYFDTLETALVRYVEENAFYQQYKISSEERIQAFIERINRDIRQLDSVKLAVLATGRSQGAVQPEGLFSEGLNLYRKKEALQRQLEDFHHVQVVVPFTPQAKPHGPKKWNFLLVGALVGGLLGTALAYYRDKKRGKI
ncbi:hypothetical protein GU926_03495 [Nibribacter ruber]|uniref:Polysaccharide chain length determinant N-terminal domain-containing protein n=1 Tax=Nibribacter ruber TaxID=2698458 RepID=A0A6P1NW52_9BACT|nr:hypothetical protein [Nibribacter ruber]QHL86554.1 hypothetical protein GU926_03495 [Nibribacter ruber]